MLGQSEPEQTLNFEGPKGETIFRRFLIWCLPPEWEQAVQAELDGVLSHLSSEDDRAIALAGALVVENALDGLLSAHMPGYGTLRENRDFTFSMKIGLARALRLCPTRIFGAADAVRNVRNDFAHNLKVASFAECNPKHLRSLEGHLQEINDHTGVNATPRDVFKNLAGFVFLALRGYEFHVKRLNEYLRGSEDFMSEFMKHCQMLKPKPAIEQKNLAT